MDGKIKRQMDLNELAFQKLRELKTKNRNIISFPKVRQKICTQFSINKQDCWKLLNDFSNEGKVRIICGHGVEILD